MNWQESFKIGLPYYTKLIKKKLKTPDYQSIELSVKDSLIKIHREDKLFKLKTKEYKKQGKYPIIDQGKKLIVGFTNDDSILFSENLPVIIFGDHTKNFKFINFPFAVGADGTKILKPNKGIDEKFFFYSLFDFNPYEKGYSRYFKQLSIHRIVIPFSNNKKKSLEVQQSISLFLDQLEKYNLSEEKVFFDAGVESEIKRVQNLIYKAGILKAELSRQLDIVKKIRRQILQDAVCGKLVKQNAEDEPASILLEKIKAEKALLSKDKKGKKDKALQPIKQEEIPFEIPENWIWCRLGEIITMVYGDSLTKAQTIPDGKYPVFGSNGIVGYYNEYLTDKRAIIIGRKGSSGALNICEVPSWTTDVAYYVEENKYFDFYFMYHLLKTLELDKLGKGIKPGLDRNEAYELLIPLPPLSEQHRIVVKAETLMSLCDKLEENIKQNQSYTEQLLKSALKEALQE